MIFPIVVVGVGVAGIGTALYYLKQWSEREGPPIPPLPNGDNGEKNGEDNGAVPDNGDGNGGGGQQKQGAKCSRTGETYNAVRWATPAHIAAFLMVLGYPTGPTLTSASDKVQIKRFQQDATKLGLRGLKGAGSKWHDGSMGACTLLALSNAEALHKAGRWIPRQTDAGGSTADTWFTKMMAQAGWV